MNDVHTVITGVGVFACGFRNAAAWLRGEPDPAVEVATGDALDKRSRRRASRLTRALSDVVSEAAAQAGADLGVVPTVFGSALGEANTMIGLLDTMWRERTALSPTSFAMSVHNAASGLISIAAGNRGFTTSLAADYDTPAATLYEAVGLALEGDLPVVVACADEAAPKDLVPGAERFELLATALVLARPGSPAAARGLATMRGPWGPVLEAPSVGGAATADELARNPQVGLLDVVDAVLRGRFGMVRLDRGRGRGLVVELSPP